MAAAKGVPMYDAAEGRVRVIHPADVQQAIDEGLVTETAEDRERREYREQAGVGDIAIAAAEGLAKGATLGVSDIVAGEVASDEYLEERKLRQEEFPTISAVSEFAGGVAPALATGGTGLAARAAAYTPAGLAARGAMAVEGAVGRTLGTQLGSGVLARAATGAARMGAGAAAEGAVAGAGFALSEASLEQQLGDLGDVAERAWAGAKNGAIFGLVGGAALGGVAAGAGPSAAALFKRAGYTGDELADQANIQALKASGAIQSDFAAVMKRGKGKQEQVGNDLRTYRLEDGRAVIEAWEDVHEVGAKITQAKEEIGAKLGALREQVKDVTVTGAASTWIDDVRREVLDPLLSNPLPAIRARAKSVEQQLEGVAARIATAKVGQAETATYLSKLDAVLADPLVSSGDQALAALGAQAKTRIQQATAAAASGGLTRAELASLRKTVLEPLKAVPLRAVADAAAVVDDDLLRSRLTSHVDPVTHGELASLRSSLADLVYPKKPPGGGVPAPVPENAQQLFEVERKLEGVLERELDAAMQRVNPDAAGTYGETKRLYESFKTAEEINLRAQNRQMGNRAVSLSDYLAGIGSAGPVIGALAGGHVGAAVGALANVGVAWGHKLLRERGNAFLATLLTRHQQAEARMGGAFNSFFQRARAAAKAGAVAGVGVAAGQAAAYDVRRTLRAQKGESAEDAYDRILTRAQDISSGRALGPYAMENHAPRTAHQMRQTQLKAAQHLLRHAPVPPQKTKNPNLGALSAQVRPDPVQLYEFSQRVRAIEDPYSVLDDLRAGTLSVAAIEAVRDVYPRQYANMQARALEGLAGSKELLPYEERIRLGLLFQIPTDPTLRPEYLAFTQSVYRRQAQPPQAGASPTTTLRSNALRSAAQELSEPEPVT